MSENNAINVLKNAIETKTTHHIAYDDLEEFTEQFYGNRISLAEITNDTTYEYKVTDKEDPFGEDDMKQAIETGDVYNYDTVLNDLCRKGYIPAGAYFIRVCW